MTAAFGFEHRFEPATVPGLPPLLLLHGTGGNEDDLLPLGRSIASGAALLSPRGNVLERGMPRFFRRLAEGVFDPAEVRQRSLELADFVEAARRAYGLAVPIAVGYSNGANVAAAAMLLRPGLFGGAILMRPMLVLDEAAAGMEPTSVLMLSGAADPIVSAVSARALAVRLREGGAGVDHRTLPAGHQLTREDVTLAKTWLDRIFGRPGDHVTSPRWDDPHSP